MADNRAREDAMILSASPSLQPTLERVAELAKLPPDWDADGSPPPSPVAVAEACRLLVAVYEAADRSALANVLPFHVAPVPGGGILLEWRGTAEDVEVDVDAHGALGYLTVDRRPSPPRFEERDGAAWAEVVAAVAQVIDPTRPA
jgi:hypothetical protein